MASPNISFDSIPSSLKKPGKYFEFNTKLASSALPSNGQKVLLIGKMNATSTAAGAVNPTATKEIAYEIFSTVEAEKLFGVGSQLANMVAAALKANKYVSLHAAALTSAATTFGGALTNTFAEHYHIIVSCFSGATALGVLKTHIESVSDHVEQRGAVAVFATTPASVAVSAAKTLSTALSTSGRMLHVYLPGTSTAPEEVAAAFGATMGFEEDPARPLNTLTLKGIKAPAIANRLTRAEQESLLAGGVTPIEVDATGQEVQIVRAVSTYDTDTALVDITTIRTLDYVRQAVRGRLVSRYPRAKLSTKTPASVRAEVLDVLLRLESLEIIENVEANADGLIVEKDSQDANRLNVKIPTDVVNGLHILAGRIDLIL